VCSSPLVQPRVAKLLQETRFWGIELHTIARGSVSLQELRWIERSARAAKLDGPWCRISDAIGLLLEAYRHRLSDDYDETRMEEAKQKILRLAGT